MACKKGMPGRSADDYGVPTISANDSTPSNCSFECVEKSHTRTAKHCTSTAASRLGGHRFCPMLLSYADISMAHLTVRGETLRLPAEPNRPTTIEGSVR